ncbi:glycosyltransferase [Hoeflea sp. YIM 152468]|uniref:glycosyltransferase n=1 Tax=Hoeflea sp. YIM 152468 TaxID=3031759 RepID=UPI0023DB055B|nr:glycosyltransferase [Hoeflea sp. YIM 152468]MDF1610264.1 glycosyltransferase [Hoeflea sp. YIM 152468]
MRILFVCNDLDYFLAHRSNLLKPLLERGHDVSLCAGGNSGSASQLPDGIHFIPVTLNQHHLDPLSDLKLTAQYAHIVAETRPDAVHCFTIKPNLYMALALASRRLMRKKTPRLVQTFPGLGKVFEPSTGAATSFRRWIVAILLRASCSLLDRSVTFENAFDRDVMVQAGIVDAAHAHVIAGAGLDLDTYVPPPVQRKGELSFLFASRLLNAKGVDTFLEVAKTVRSDTGAASFLIAGKPDPHNPDQFDMAQLYAAQDRGEISYLGPLTSSQMVAALQDADVVCLPTRLREGFPRILAEAAACGCALIASDQPAIRQILRQPENGWLIDPADARDLTAAVRQCLADPDRIRAMGMANAIAIRRLPVDDTSVSSAFRALYGL